MAYHLELYNNANTTRIGYLSRVVKGSSQVIIELNGENTLSFSLEKKDRLYSQIIGKRYIRMVNDSNAADYKSFIIEFFENGPGRTLRIECEGLKYALMNNILALKQGYVDISVATALNIVLAGSGFSAGTIDPPGTNLASITFNAVNSLEGLQQIVDTWYYEVAGVRKRYYYRVNENKTVDILTEANLGVERDFYIHYDKNIIGLTRTRNFRDMANRVFGIGAEGFNFKRHGGVLRSYVLPTGLLTASDGATTYLQDSDAPELAVDDLQNGMRMEIFAGTGSGQKRLISDTVGSSHAIYPDTNFSPAPDATSQYRIGHLYEEESETYDLGLAYGDANPLKIGSRVKIKFKYFIAWEPLGLMATMSRVVKKTFAPASMMATDYVIMTFRVALLDNNSVELASATSTASYDYPLTESPNDIYLYVDVGALENIHKIKLTLLAAEWHGVYTGEVHVRPYLIEYYQSPNTAYIDDATSQGTYGTVSGPYEDSSIEDIVNLVKTPALDGTYTAGLCQDWTKVGLPTVSENTNVAYIKNGTKSQKVIANDGGQGILQTVEIRRNQPLSTTFNVYIAGIDQGSGNTAVRVSLSAPGLTEIYQIVQATGMIEVKIENFSYDADLLYIAVLSESDSVIFYPDSMQINEGATAKPFTRGDSADLLYNKSETYLKLHKDPDDIYDLDLLDLSQTDPVKYANHDFNVGDSVRLADEELQTDSRLLVIRKGFDPYNPANCKVGLGKKPDSIKKSLIRVVNSMNRTGREI